VTSPGLLGHFPGRIIKQLLLKPASRFVDLAPGRFICLLDSPRQPGAELNVECWKFKPYTHSVRNGPGRFSHLPKRHSEPAANHQLRFERHEVECMPNYWHLEDQDHDNKPVT